MQTAHQKQRQSAKNILILPFIWSKLIRQEIPLLMVAGRAGWRSLLSFENVSAVCADPFPGIFTGKIFVLFQHLGHLRKTELVSPFYFRDQRKSRCGFQEAFFLGNPGKFLVYVVRLFLFIVLRGPDQLCKVFLLVHRISSVNKDRLSRQAFQQFIIPLRMGAFLLCRVLKNIRDRIHFHLPRFFRA